MDSSKPRSPGQTGLWPGLWVPLVILIVGLTATATMAHFESSRASELAEAHYQAQHQALVNLLLARVPTRASENASTQEWLHSVFDEALPPSLGVRVDTLSRHTKRPLLQIRTQGSIDPTRALRTEVNYGDFSWMLTTVPSRSLLEQSANSAHRNVWLAGGTLTLVATLLALFQCRRLHGQSLQIVDLERRGTGADQHITNLQVEKSILRQALNDSEQRSRDLIALSGAIISELDEMGLIGFISPQVAELLARAPADLIGEPFERLIEPDSRENFRRALTAARADHSIERIDLPLLHRDEETVLNVAIRILALQDPVHGLSGYRLGAFAQNGH
ncbi:PAS domain-containing protein [Marinobacter sp. F4218]|uniref:PAS domain-containing protein n=1 Tax=Marinobacter sp. F4218 TaxID=2862868 RepID=UPI001C62C75E|nr:PAS domain-containing protein [Marinobacter sp. F4218]MBW7471563.1 PAS domain-containing protein [Marinobacter sp. F4218]